MTKKNRDTDGNMKMVEGGKWDDGKIGRIME